MLDGDSLEYEILEQAASRLFAVPGVTCEIGVRLGGGTKAIIDGLVRSGVYKHHIGIDPYGDIDKIDGDGVVVRGYTNSMRRTFLRDIYKYCFGKPVDFTLFTMTDVEFFNRFADGFALYDKNFYLVNSYALVHYDGPHNVNSILTEVQFFRLRTPMGGWWVFDDLDLYDHNPVEQTVLECGFTAEIRGKRKVAYRRVK